MSSATKTARMRAEVRLSWIKEIVKYLRKYVDLPPLNLPAFNVPPNVEDISLEFVEELAASCRSFYNLGDGPILDMVLLLENNGVLVSRMELGAETLDALSMAE